VIAKKIYKIIETKINTQPIGIKKNGSLNIPSLSSDEPANSNTIKQMIPIERVNVAILNLLSIQSTKFHNFKLINIYNVKVRFRKNKGFRKNI